MLQTGDGRLSVHAATLAQPKSPRLAQEVGDIHVRHVAHHEHLFFEGDAQSYLYEVERGIVCLYKLHSDGRRQIISFCYPGDVIGLGSPDVHFCSAEAMSETSVRCIPLGAIKRMVQADARFGQRLLDVLATELAASRGQILRLGRPMAIEKVASFLISIARRSSVRNGDGVKLELPMLRADIADFLGLTLETVSRTFTKLKLEGIIELPSSKTVIIRDKARLENLAEGECLQA
jgi:CRP-like cAMP-binding protein